MVFTLWNSTIDGRLFIQIQNGSYGLTIFPFISHSQSRNTYFSYFVSRDPHRSKDLDRYSSIVVGTYHILWHSILHHISHIFWHTFWHLVQVYIWHSIAYIHTYITLHYITFHSIPFHYHYHYHTIPYMHAYIHTYITYIHYMYIYICVYIKYIICMYICIYIYHMHILVRLSGIVFGSGGPKELASLP